MGIIEVIGLFYIVLGVSTFTAASALAMILGCRTALARYNQGARLEADVEKMFGKG